MRSERQSVELTASRCMMRCSGLLLLAEALLDGRVARSKLPAHPMEVRSQTDTASLPCLGTATCRQTLAIIKSRVSSTVSTRRPDMRRTMMTPTPVLTTTDMGDIPTTEDTPMIRTRIDTGPRDMMRMATARPSLARTSAPGTLSPATAATTAPTWHPPSRARNRMRLLPEIETAETLSLVNRPPLLRERGVERVAGGGPRGGRTAVALFRLMAGRTRPLSSRNWTTASRRSRRLRGEEAGCLVSWVGVRGVRLLTRLQSGTGMGGVPGAMAVTAWWRRRLIRQWEVADVVEGRLKTMGRTRPGMSKMWTL